MAAGKTRHFRVARPHDAILGLVPGLAGMHDVDDYPQARTIPGLVVYRYDAPLFFANAQDFRRRALAAARCHDTPRWFVLNVEANVEVGFTALEAVEALREEFARYGVVFARPRKAGPARQAHRVRPCCHDRPEPAVPDPAHRGRRLPPVGRRPRAPPRRGTRRSS